MDLRGYVIGVDVDEVCAEMIPRWLDLYNKLYNDTLTPDKITDWDMCQFVKPECGAKIYDLLRVPDFYEHVRPVEGYPEGIMALRDAGADVYYVSSCVPGTLDQKMSWLARHDPALNWKKVYFGHDKFRIKLDVLLDDAAHNLEAAPRGCATVHFRKPHSRNAPASEHVDGWTCDIVQVVDDALTFCEARYVEDYEDLDQGYVIV